MIVKNTKVFGIPHAMYGMRRALNSHDKSDSEYCHVLVPDPNKMDIKYSHIQAGLYGLDEYKIGKNDMLLAKKLIGGGGEHRKFLRFIHVQADLTLPLKVWKQFDTYHHAEKLSDSTMHCGMNRDLKLSDFESSVTDFYPELWEVDEKAEALNEAYTQDLQKIIEILNDYRVMYMLGTNPVEKQMIFSAWSSLLPDGYLQTRTIDTNYETLLNIYKQRRTHKMRAWREVCKWIESLPYMKEFLGGLN